MKSDEWKIFALLLCLEWIAGAAPRRCDISSSAPDPRKIASCYTGRAALLRARDPLERDPCPLKRPARIDQKPWKLSVKFASHLWGSCWELGTARDRQDTNTQTQLYIRKDGRLVVYQKHPPYPTVRAFIVRFAGRRRRMGAVWAVQARRDASLSGCAAALSVAVLVLDAPTGPAQVSRFVRPSALQCPSMPQATAAHAYQYPCKPPSWPCGW